MKVRINRIHTLWTVLAVIGLMFFVMRCGEKQKQFTELPAAENGIGFSNTITEAEDMNINQYLYAHNGGGVAIGDINNDGLPDIYFTANQLSDKLYVNKGSLRFEDITEKAGVAGSTGTQWKTGVVMADVNGDGWLDLYVSQVSNYRSFDGANHLYINNGDLTFSDKSIEFGLDLRGYSQQAAFFDYDGDGDLDLFQMNQAVHNPDVYIRAELRTRRDSLAGDRLFRNDGGKFKDVSALAGVYGGAAGYGLGLSIADIDNNGTPDIYVSNDFHENDYVYYNNGNGTFREDIRGTLGHCSTFSMGNDIADFNNDGWLDIFTLDMKPADEMIRKRSAGPDPFDIYNYKLSFGYYYQYPRNMLHLNRGNLFEKNVQYSEIGQLAGVDATDWSWSGLFADMDNDGWKDLFITNGIIRRPIDLDYINFTYNDEITKNMSSLEMAYKMPDGAVNNYAYRNDGKLKFEDVSNAWGLDRMGYSMGAAYGDLDNDGDLDLVVNNLNATASVYRNNSESISVNHFVRTKLIGKNKNIFGIGARVDVKTRLATHTQELNPVRGWLSSVDYTLVFGIGEADSIETITVKWPDGSTQLLTNPAINSTVTFRQADAAQNLPVTTAPKTKLFEDVTAGSGIAFRHAENDYAEFNDQRLMPRMLSTEGPKLTIADINNDGLEDFFVGGALGQPGAIYLQRQTDSVFFERQIEESIDADQHNDQVESAFFDADSDGDVDLYVVLGGGQWDSRGSTGNPLYLNDGTGKFTRSTSPMPGTGSEGSCVVAEDFNGDGRIDLFVGNRSLPGRYGLPSDSYLLWNTGHGTFSKDTTSRTSVLRNLGMVTDAVWLKKSKELVVVGEWMPVTFLKFSGEQVQKVELPNTSGWWNTVYADDLDKDGDEDLLCGNLGLNTDLRASVSQPVRLYVNDYDSNQNADPILTYYRQNKEWIYLGFDEIKKQLPPIRLRYTTYKDFSEHTFTEMFAASTIRNSVRKEAQMFQSVYLVNDGAGNFEVNDLPMVVQFSPVYSFLVDDFDDDGLKDILAVGNFYGNTTTLGRSDASYGNFLRGNGKNKFTPLEPSITGFAVYGEARDMKLIQAQGEKWIIIGRNNVPMRVLRRKSNHKPHLKL